jgi:beta-glucanase (GH16 family)
MQHDVLSYHFLLWPKSEKWPPEIDIAESFDGDRQSVQGFVHWRDAGGVRRKTTTSVAADFRDWRTVGVEWTPEAVRFTLDGVEWGVVTGAAVPHEPMWLALQVETHACPSSQACRGPAASVVEVDWVQVDSWRPSVGVTGSLGAGVASIGG